MIVKRTERLNTPPKTKIISVRIPEFIDRRISDLISLGLFKDRSDFVNYAIQRALLEIIEKMEIVQLPSEEEVRVVLSTKPKAPISEKEIPEVIENVDKELKNSSEDSDRSKRYHIRCVRRSKSRPDESTSNAP